MTTTLGGGDRRRALASGWWNDVVPFVVEDHFGTWTGDLTPVGQRVEHDRNERPFDDGNRAAVAVIGRADMDVVGLAVRAERNIVDKIVDGLKLHG